MRLLAIALAVSTLSLVLAPAAALPPLAGVTLASGPASHTYVTSGTCEAPMTLAVEYNVLYRTMVLASPTSCIDTSAYWATVGGCSGGRGGEIRCDRTTATNDVHVRLQPDGAFTLTWAGPGFFETITGQLDRVDA